MFGSELHSRPSWNTGICSTTISRLLEAGMKTLWTYASDNGGCDTNLVGPRVLLGLLVGERAVAFLEQWVYEGTVIGSHSLGGGVASVGLALAKRGGVDGDGGQNSEDGGELHDW